MRECMEQHGKSDEFSTPSDTTEKPQWARVWQLINVRFLHISLLLIRKNFNDLGESAFVSPPISEPCLAEGALAKGKGRNA